jgi:curved DNA-binding protein
MISGAASSTAPARNSARRRTGDAALAAARRLRRRRSGQRFLCRPVRQPRRRPPAPAGAARGEDSHASITIDLADSYHGATRTVSLMLAERDAQDRIVTRERNLSVNIPKGVTAGQQLRLAGQGQPGAAGPGDLYLEIQFRPDARYRLDGRDVYQTVPVAPWELALGGEIEVSTPSGKVT